MDAASSPVPAWKKRYDVFISFRGEDTRNNFVSHLYRDFCGKKIKAYIDEDSLSRGDEISPALKKGIQESKISVVVLSENYASSSWCLNELNHILECKETDEQIVIPVFYHVDPSHVRKQEGSYETAFAKHGQRLSDAEISEAQVQEWMDMVQKWRNALTSVSNLSGLDSSVIGSDSKLVEAIVKDVLEKLNCIAFDNFKGLIGVDEQIEQIESLLNLSSPEVRIVGIWGIGGIGKTTLARVVFNRLASQFEGHCFLENVKEASKGGVLSNLQKGLFSELLGGESLKTVNKFVKDRLRGTKVLIVLDDVDNAEQLEYLAGERDRFGPGSKIIITTRDAQVLHNIDAHKIHKVEELNFDDALQLFCSKAFRGKSLPTDYNELSRRVLNYAQGVPLALKVLGDHLCSKSTRVWESALDKLKEAPNAEIQRVLRISYDGLEHNEKEIFLDIACFFKDKKQNFGRRILDACDLHMDVGIEILIDKSLIALRQDRFWTHDLVQEMGREIVRGESKEPGKRSRLWLAKDTYHVLKNNTGTAAIQGMSLKMIELSKDIYLDPQVFKEMCNLKFLEFIHQYGCTKKLYLPQGLHSLPDELRYLRWDHFPLKSLPQNFTPQNLVELHLENSHLESLPNEIQHFDALQILNLNGSRRLEKFPELPRNIRKLNMNETAIEIVPPSIEYLSHLKTFNLAKCKRLTSLPTSMCKLKLLEGLNLYGCSKLEYLPEILEPMEHLTDLTLVESGIRELPSSIENLSGIVSLDCTHCENLKFVPNTIYINMRLEMISFRHCENLEILPPLFYHGLPFLTQLDLSYTSISEIPNQLFSLHVLREFNLCKTNISSVPESITYSNLCDLYIRDCKFLQCLPGLPLSINIVDARGCTSLETVSNSRLASIVLSFGWFAVPDCPSDFVRLSFCDCKRLNWKNLFTEFQIRALCNIVFFKEHQKAAIICFPGYRVPNWFNYQNKGCSINIKPPPYWSEAIDMVLCFCFVLAFKKNGKNVGHILQEDSRFELECEMIVKTDCGARHLRMFIWHINSAGRVPDLNHVFMVTHSYVRRPDVSSAKEVSFEFRLTDSVEIEIQRCGIRIVRLQDTVDFVTRSGEYQLGGSSDFLDEPEECRFNLIDSETVEPHRKRAKSSISACELLPISD